MGHRFFSPLLLILRRAPDDYILGFVEIQNEGLDVNGWQLIRRDQEVAEVILSVYNVSRKTVKYNYVLSLSVEWWRLIWKKLLSLKIGPYFRKYFCFTGQFPLINQEGKFGLIDRKVSRTHSYRRWGEGSILKGAIVNSTDIQFICIKYDLKSLSTLVTRSLWGFHICGLSICKEF